MLRFAENSTGRSVSECFLKVSRERHDSRGAPTEASLQQCLDSGVWTRQGLGLGCRVPQSLPGRWDVILKTLRTSRARPSRETLQLLNYDTIILPNHTIRKNQDAA